MLKQEGGRDEPTDDGNPKENCVSDKCLRKRD